MAVGNRFGELMHEEKQLISSMLKELTEYELYLNALRDASRYKKLFELALCDAAPLRPPREDACTARALGDDI